MKLLLVADNLVAGGRERRMLEFIKGLVERNHTVILVLFRDAIHYKEIYELPVELIVLKKRFQKDVFVYFKLFGICRRLQPDLIHSCRWCAIRHGGFCGCWLSFEVCERDDRQF